MREVFLLLLLAAALFVPGTAQAQASNRAALVVVHGDGRVLTRCVAFDEATISGDMLLARAGLELHVEAEAMGPSICRIDREGCGPGEGCFCRCQSATCEYWSYWRWQEGVWVYSGAGAGTVAAGDGALQAWVWSVGKMGDDKTTQPPPLGFDEVCASAPVAEVLSRKGVALDLRDWAWLRTLGVVLFTPLLAGGVWIFLRAARRRA